MADWSVRDVPQKPELATPTNALKIVNGESTQNGVSALNHVTGVHKIEHVPYNNLQRMVEGSVSEKQSSSGIAISIHAQWIANGVFGVHGIYALNHVVEECRVGKDQLRDQKEMEENLVSATHWKCDNAICNLVKSVRIVLGMPHIAQHGRLIVPKVHLSRVVVENLVICVEVTVPNKRSRY